MDRARAFDGALGIGLLFVLPFLFGLIAICLAMMSPVVIWRAIETRCARWRARIK